MKNSAKFCVVFVSIFFSAGACEPREGWTGGGPITMFLLGTWKLERVVTPKRTALDTQIGYSEVLKIAYKAGYHIEESYRDDTLSNTQFWQINPSPIAKTKDMTLLISYRYGLKRFYKMHRTVSQPTILEASAYLPELGGANDTVKFFYKQVW
ncbi:hypothetical protein LXM25_22160 [Dyadobacter sp. LJ53]|uniref:hypothetical protein n=1 Tax=Dyadobacter chenwenxiniae TaxID=2906456 RepID=UPI001F20CE49|nr:hypothetical protein [Dyadobacter chenwenxiniae]MCF0052791.1 hypothetical protein [Dyadobacter chenwenxiniae]